MGRVKKQKINMKQRNIKKIAQRWASEKDSGDVEIIADEGRYSPNLESVASTSGTDVFSSRPNTENIMEDSIQCSSSTEDKSSNKPTGFALYTSYKKNIELSDDGPQYVFTDLKLLTEYLQSFPCNNCYCETLEAIQVDKKSVFANPIQVTCTTCSFVSTLQMSSRLSNNESPKRLYDINRRIVKAFASIGKGHRALNIFCMTMNMKSMDFKTFYSHVKALHQYLKLCSNNQETSGIKLGNFSSSIAKRLDKAHLRLSLARKEEKNIAYRNKLKQAQMEEEERLKEKEGQMYGAGLF